MPVPSRALFSPRATTLLHLGLWVLLLLVALGLLLPMAIVRSDYVTGANQPYQQPVLFDHRHHVVDDGIDCRYCHSGAWTSAYAGIPASSICMNCHSQVWKDAPMLAPVRDSWQNGRSIPWVRVHRLPQFVFFDHSAHVQHGVGCSSCHGAVETMATVHAVAPLTMGWCIDCHRHPQASLRPLDRITDTSWRSDALTATQRDRLVQALRVDPPLSCSGCHR